MSNYDKLLGISVPEVESKVRSKDAKDNNYYFDNERVEDLVSRYVERGCVDIDLRDKIMSHASELIKQVIKTHKLNVIYKGRDPTAFGELFQIAWIQIESSLYKFDYSPGHKKIFNFWCTSPKTMVFTSSGISRLGDIISLSKDYDTIYKSENDIRFIGSDSFDKLILGPSGFTKINASIIKTPSPAVEVSTELGYKIVCSNKHKLMSIVDDNVQLLEVGNLNEGDLVGINFGQNVYIDDDDLSDITLKEEGEWIPPSKFTPELAYILGLYMAEGYYNRNQFVIHNVNEDIIDSILNNKLGLNFVNHPKMQATILCNVRFSEFLDKLGFKQHTNANKKFIPQRLLKCSKEIIFAILRGLFDGDEYSTRHNGTIGITSTSELLIDQIRMILLNGGILTKVYRDNRTEQGFETHKGELNESWQLTANTRFSKLFYETIGFNIKHKKEKHKFLKTDKQKIYGLNKKFRSLYLKYGPGRLGFNKVRTVIREDIERDFCILSTAIEKLESWCDYSYDDDYKYVKERIDELVRPANNVIWLPILKKSEVNEMLCDISIDSDDHLYYTNGFTSHNSQVARTVLLAHIKKESKDIKSNDSYREYVRNKNDMQPSFERFLQEAKVVCGNNQTHLKIVHAIEELYDKDPDPHEGFVNKLIETSGLSKTRINNFLNKIRSNSVRMRFSDAPGNIKSKIYRDYISYNQNNGNGDSYDS